MIEKRRVNPRETKEAIRGFWTYEEFDRALAVLSSRAEGTCNDVLRARMVRAVRMAVEYAYACDGGIRTRLLPHEHALMLHASCAAPSEGLTVVSRHSDVLARAGCPVPFGRLFADGVRTNA